MWICPKCKREFKRQNQGHYCGEAPTNVNDYIMKQNETQQKYLTELADVIRDVVPDVKEEVKWSMPSFQSKKGAVQFAACKNWISLYIGADVIVLFKDRIDGLSYKKDALYLPYDKPVPEELLREIFRFVMLGEKD